MANQDEQVMALMTEVNKREAEIKQAERPNWKTNCSFNFAQGKPINLHVESDVKMLATVVCFLQTLEKGYGQACETLGIDLAGDITWDGFAMKDWIHDIRLRVNKIQIQDKKKKLATLKKRLDKIVSPELKAKMELEAISKELG